MKNKKVYCFFIDLKAAFDSIDRNALFIKLYNLQVSTKFIKIIKALYEQTKADVRLKDGISESFRQGQTGLFIKPYVVFSVHK